jgi:drug/metabolite transporter (DMT)-like permease
MALVSAALFGASTPLAKLLLGAGVSPWLLAGLLYLGSGLGLLFILLARRAFGLVITEAPLRRTDLPWLAAVALFGGIAGPVMLMLGLASTPASTASLLLNLEGLATMAIAWLVFRENVDHRLLLGAGAILAGALALSFSGPLDGVGLGGLAIAGACLAWGIDNNLTRKLSSADPLQITAVKGVVAGTVNLVLALANGAQLPSANITMAAGLLGLAGYGVSLILFVLALRHLGTARTGAYFSTAPFLGAVLAIAFLGEPATLPLLIAAILMAGGVWLHLSERHAHDHSHEALEHEHRHTHDDHHQHLHDDGTAGDVTHSHRHRHEPLTHRHPHFPDLHHRHRHS